MSVVLVVCYFGRLPFWMPAFLKTCATNQSINWLIFTDSEHPRAPRNVRFINLGLADFIYRTKEQTGVLPIISNKNIYKVCDFKGAFGDIFEDYITNYDFWGHCDIDILWGNIRQFMKPSILNRYDLITGRKKKIGGHFTIYKNTREMRNLYKTIPEIWGMLSSPEHYAVDETKMTQTLHSKRAVSLQGLAHKLGLSFGPSAPRIYWKQELTVNGGRQILAKRTKGKCLHWNDGRAFDTEGNEVMYLHFHRLKESMTPANSSIPECTSKLFLDDRGIFGSPPTECGPRNN